MPTANRTDPHRRNGLLNSEPMKTISADIPTNKPNVFAPFA